MHHDPEHVILVFLIASFCINFGMSCFMSNKTVAGWAFKVLFAILTLANVWTMIVYLQN